MSKGRKKKLEILLEEKTPYKSFSEISVSNEMLIWEYINVRDSSKKLEKIALSRKADEKYWTDLIPSRGSIAKMMLTKLTTDSKGKATYIFDKYSNKKILLNELVYSVADLCLIKNIDRNTASRYIYAINSFMDYLVQNKYENIKSVNDMNLDFQSLLRIELSNKQSKIFNEYGKRSYTRNILVYAINKFGKNENILNQSILLRKKMTGSKPRMDLSQEIAVQLLSASIVEMDAIMKKREKLEKEWRPTYHNKSFDSLENLANAYLNYPQIFHKKTSTRATLASIANYRAKYDRLCLSVYGYKLSDLSENDLAKLALKGENIDELQNPRMMAWFIDDVLIDYPLKCGKKVSADTPMSKYCHWNYNAGLRSFLIGKNTYENPSELLSLFYEILSIKYPFIQQLVPFMLYWILQTGSNTEALFNMEWREKIGDKYFEIGEYSPFGDTPVIRSYKNRGTKNWYWFPLNPNEKNGLYDIFLFLKKYLKELWKYNSIYQIEKSSKNSFWTYIVSNQSHGYVAKPVNRNIFSYELSKFLQRNKIISKDGNVIKSIELARLRNTFITAADLAGASLEEIKEWIRHDSFDTRFTNYGNSPDQRSRNFNAIYAIQESIIDSAKNFKGKIYTKHNQKEYQLKKSLSSSFLSRCTDNKNPHYTGVQDVNDNEICIDWDNCLACSNSRVFKEHLPRICYRIMQYEKFQSVMTADEWENNYGSKYLIAKDVLKKWIDNGGTHDDLNLAWEEAKSGKVKLPAIFPQGFMKTLLNNNKLVS
ncbi:hypothetical protein MLC35_05320 [Sulfurimonas sp. NW7]|uniref:hypothetical protein n=1 Tax=Sulfurimonas sp. NW7 TaxID=2922727 RepID=UPI003DA8FF03